MKELQNKYSLVENKMNIAVLSCFFLLLLLRSFFVLSV